MHQLKVGVVEDEMVIADTICLTLRKLGYYTTSTSQNYTRAIKMLQEEKPNLLLIDINLGGGKDGIDLAHYIRDNYSLPFIFLTANSDNATIERAKKVRPNAFLVKPFNKNDLYAAIEIAVSNFSVNNLHPKTEEFIMIKDGYDFIKVFYNDILFIHSDQNYAVFHLSNGKKIMTRSTLTEMTEKLPAGKFMKVNRGTIVHLKHITSIQTDKVLIDTHDFSINKIVREELVNILKNLG